MAQGVAHAEAGRLPGFTDDSRESPTPPHAGGLPQSPAAGVAIPAMIELPAPPSSTGAAVPPVPFLQIKASHGWVSLRLSELWDYRELLYFLTWRDIKVRYKQTALGVVWGSCNRC